ncbi:hypothetical protein, partial [Faecalibaculum rodentium]|uniref:hypothetical protein n=1 Tax=Faecalibaculum rodentium TaxID=1702221 RepID=UPI002570C442
MRLINARSRSSDLPGTVLHDLWRDDPGKMKHPMIRRMVEDLKNSEGGWRSMCKIADECGRVWKETSWLSQPPAMDENRNN